MQLLKDFIDLFLHLDDSIGQLIASFGSWSYAIVFLVIFCETGLVFLPFLPGDSLLFVLGAFAASGHLNIFILWGLLTLAAILGDSLNYWIGSKMLHVIQQKNQNFINPNHLKKTQEFYDKYGDKAIVLARFIPIFRTVVPFLAGAAKMDYRKFITYNILGGLLWVSVCLLSGWWFGRLPWVEKNFSLVIFAIILISLIPPVVEFLKHKRQSSLNK